MIAWGFVFAGVAAIVVSTLGAVTLSTVFDRLHLLTVVTSFGAPLIALGLIILSGWGAESAMIALITAVMVVTGPAMSAATARMTAEREGLIDVDWPA